MAFYVDNLKKCVDRILKFGGRKIGEVVSLKTEKGTLEFIYMADPENNIIELQTIYERGDNEMSKRDELANKLKQQLNEWNRKIDSLEVKVQSATTTVQDKYRKELEFIKSKRDDLNIKLKKAKNSSGEALDELKAGLIETTGILKKTFDNVWSKFKK